jgi:hypothetical protein
MNTKSPPLVLILCGCLASLAQAAPPPGAARAKLEFFENQVRPLLVERCRECHGVEKQEGGLRVDSLEALLRGGQSGAAIVAGRPEASLLMEAVRYEDLEMPPDDKLADDQIAALEKWIRDGAVWPKGDAPAGPALGDQKAIFAQAQTHWSLVPVVKPPVPQVQSAAVVRTPVDAFINEKLAAAGLTPAPDADPATLIRRVYFDLVGLPPMAVEVDEFVRTYSDDAYAALVDKLLASPHYGERWGRHWLDVARYADTRDFIAAGADRRYPYAYTYRDWVVKAFNDDLPYDEFIRLQLAADAYATDPQSPSRAALGLLMVGPRFGNNANEQIADRIDVVGRGFLGLAITCARCHDHKYDPIPTADYYALHGVFASCEEPAEMPLIAGMIPPADLLKDYERVRAEKVADKTKYAEQLRDEATTDLRARLADYLAGYYEMNIAKSESIRGLLSNRKLKETAMAPLADNLDAAKRSAAGRNDPVLGPLLHLLNVIDKNFEGHARRMLATGKTADEKSPVPINAVVLERLKAKPPADKKAVLAVYGELLAEADKRAKSDAAWAEIAKVFDDADSPFVLQPNACMQAARLQGAARQKQADLDNAIKDVDITHPGAPAKAFVLADKPKPVEPYIFLRGDPQRRGDKVSRHFLSVLGGGDQRPFTIGSGRKELAEAIASPTNPLTARVFVNRVWMHHFGDGIVDTEGDFGLRSNPPSHPELLDWLAATFVESGWSVKQLHRVMVLSSAYRRIAELGARSAERQTSDRSALPAPRSALEIDPENRLLARASRRRLDFESMRDAMLAVAGNLDESVGGRAVELGASPLTRRRTIYGFVDRLNLDPVFTTFDFASPDVSIAERPNTMVPQQALYGMNHPFVIAQARALCESAEFAAAKDDAARATVLYRRVFGRAPTADETKLAAAFVSQPAAGDEEAAGRAVWRYGFGAAEPSAPAEDRFRELTFYDGRYYQASKDYPDPRLFHLRLSAVGGHPGRDLEHAVVRRWTAPLECTVSITGTLVHLRDAGDGIRGRIVTGDGRVLGEWKLLNDKAETTVEQVEVGPGDVIDFVVDCVGKATNDAFTWAPTVTLIAKPGGRRVAASWNAKSDFAAPPPPLLTPWEQTAQALLLTNEFWFVD